MRTRPVSARAIASVRQPLSTLPCGILSIGFYYVIPRDDPKKKAKPSGAPAAADEASSSRPPTALAGAPPAPRPTPSRAQTTWASSPPLMPFARSAYAVGREEGSACGDPWPPRPQAAPLYDHDDDDLGPPCVADGYGRPYGVPRPSRVEALVSLPQYETADSAGYGSRRRSAYHDVPVGYDRGALAAEELPPAYAALVDDVEEDAEDYCHALHGFR